MVCHNIVQQPREGVTVPLVRIDVQEGRSPEQLRRLADVVQEVMLEVFDAPDRDRYQIITVHPAGQRRLEDLLVTTATPTSTAKTRRPLAVLVPRR